MIHVKKIKNNVIFDSSISNDRYILTDYILSRDIELFSYTATFFSIATRGLIFTERLMYLVAKSKLVMKSQITLLHFYAAIGQVRMTVP